MAQHDMTPDDEQAAATLPFPTLRTIGIGAPFQWIARGIGDLKACPVASLFYGFCFTAMGLLLTFVFEHAYQYTSAVSTGFLLLAPFFAMGLYELSRRRERGEQCSLTPTLTVWRRNAGNLAVFAAVLTVIFLIWARASLVIFAIFYTPGTTQSVRFPRTGAVFREPRFPDGLFWSRLHFRFAGVRSQRRVDSPYARP